MPTKVLMPALSPTMTEGKLARWLKKEGEEVKSGDVLAEIETDKATMEVEAVDEGKLGRILVPEGTEAVPVNAPIALILAEGEDAAALAKAAAVPSPTSAAAAAPTQAAPAQPAPAQPAPAQAAPPQAAPVQAAPPQAAPKPGPAAAGGPDRIFASPLAKRIAAEKGIALAGIAGSGPHGRIVKADVDILSAAPAAKAAQPGAPAQRPGAGPQLPPAAKAPPPSLPGLPPYVDEPASTMRKVIARRLVESMRDAPHFYLTIDCEIDALLKIRAELNAKSPKEGADAYKLSVNDFVIRAAALALMKVPAANASWMESAIRIYQGADISVAVAIPGGLITPVIHRADLKGLAEISNEMKHLAAKAREGKLTPEQYQGGTFSVSNLGMYGIREFSAVINPPQGAILAVGAGEPRAVVKGNALAIATVMSCTLSIDHRAVDGATGAEFLAAFKKLVEDPLTMLL